MKRLETGLTICIVVFSFMASLAGVLSYRNQESHTITTARGEVVEVAHGGVYRYSLRSLVTGGAPWDVVWLGLAIPVLAVAFGLYRRGSLRGTLLFVGILASFLCSLWTLALVLRNLDSERIDAAIGPRFPVRTLATFSFAVGGLLLVKCLGEIAPTILSNRLPPGATGYYTLVDQGLDLGLLTPFSVVSGILLLKRESLGYVLSTSALMVALMIGISVITGEVMLGLSNGHVNVPGIVIFSLFVAGAFALLATALANINRQSPLTGPLEHERRAA